MLVLLQSCASDVKPLVITEVQEQGNAFNGVKVVYKTMMRAAQYKFSSDSINLDLISQIDRIYYFQKDSSNFGFQADLGHRLDSVIAIDNYTELSKVSYKGENYSALVKSNEDHVSEILIYQHSVAGVLLIDIQGDILLRDVLNNITNLPDLLQLSNFGIL